MTFHISQLTDSYSKRTEKSEPDVDMPKWRNNALGEGSVIPEVQSYNRNSGVTVVVRNPS